MNICGHMVIFKIRVVKVQDFENFELSPMECLLVPYSPEAMCCILEQDTLFSA